MRRTPERRNEVLAAANRLIVERGLARFSMLALAQRLGMSKETLYAWFGNKESLLTELIQGNAGEMIGVLQRSRDAPMLDIEGLRSALEAFCGALLRLLCSDRSVAINRGAVHLAESGDIGSTLREHGRDAVIKALAALLRRAKAGKLLRSAGPIEAEVLAALALRDWQIERLLGRMGQPSPQRITARSREAVSLFLRLYATRVPRAAASRMTG
jgi:AcrR family transcriptional regulator